MKANRTVTSREYKLLLNPARFDQADRAIARFGDLAKFLIGESDWKRDYKYKDEFKPGKAKPVRRRKTWYLDTPGLALRNAGFVVRVRHEEAAEKRYKVTLKFRHGDRYLAAAQNVSLALADVDAEEKFEEDITPPFVSKFSLSCSYVTDDYHQPDTLKDLCKDFPGLNEVVEGLDLNEGSRIKQVNGFVAQERVQKLYKLKFKNGQKIKACMSFWYLDNSDKDWPDALPLVAEFSYDFDLPDGDREIPDTLEHFPEYLVADATRFFVAMQRQSVWMWPEGTTKTAYAYEGL